MFIVDKNGCSIVKVNKVNMCVNYDDKTLEESDNIYKRIMSKCYNYGSTENAERKAKTAAKEYIYNKYDKKIICKIYINDTLLFGEYDEIEGKNIFEKIINALKNRESFFDMREIQKGE